MSDSDDSYGPPLPPGLQSKKSDDEEFGPALPSSIGGRSQPSIGPVLPAGVKLGQHSGTSDSDSSSSESDTDRRKRKHKHRHSSSDSDSDDKHKSKKSKKHRHQSSDFRDLNESDRNKPKSFSRTIGPVLPSMAERKSLPQSIGPSLLPSAGTYENIAGSKPSYSDDDDDDGCIGPSVGLKAGDGDLSAVAEFESRAQKMKDKLTGKCSEETSQAPVRESWMTELPEHMGPGVGLGLEARQFRRSEAAERDDSWTDTPGQKGKCKDKPKKGWYDNQFQAEEHKRAANEINEYNKKHRKESLLDMHKKELKKKKKKEEKKKKKKKKQGKEEPKERVAFDRDRDLKLNKLDEAQRRAYIKRTQELGSRFKSGGAGTSFL